MILVAFSRGNLVMRPLVVGAMATALAACSYLAPQQVQQASLTESQKPPVLPAQHVAKTKKGSGAKSHNSRHRRTNAHIKNVKPHFKTTSAIAEAKIRQASQPGDNNPIIKKAEATITAKLNYPASVKFTKMKRAAAKDALGNSIDTICGYVRGKDIGDWRFLYLVQKDRAYIGSHIIAGTPYRNMCS